MDNTESLTFDFIESLIVGEIGLSIVDFDSLTWQQVENVTTGYHRRRDADIRTSWEQARMVMWSNFVPHLSKGKTLKPSELMELPWDIPVQNIELLEDPAAVLEQSNNFWDVIDNKRENREVE